MKMRGSISRNAVRHVPQRTCIACRKVKPKQELVRLVRNADGIVEVDIGGRKTGRGAYLCRAQECWETGCKSGKIEYALKISLSKENREQLINWISDFLKE